MDGDARSRWRWETVRKNQAPTWLTSVRALAKNDVWATGWYDLFHFDGQTWSTVNLPNVGDRELAGIGGVPGGNLWLLAKGAIYRRPPGGGDFVIMPAASGPCGGSDEGVHAKSATEAWVAGGNSRYLKRVTDTTVECVSDLGVEARAVYVAPSGTVFVVGGNDPGAGNVGIGRAGVLTGGAGMPTLTGSDHPAVLHAVDGAADDDVWAVGRGGYAAHWDGKQWTQEQTGTTRGFFGVRVVGGRVFAVGRRGVVAIRENGKWTVSPEPGFSETRSIFSRSAKDAPEVWITTNEGLWRYDGRALAKVEAGFNATVGARDLAGTATDDVWAAASNGTLRHYDGKQWSVVPTFKTPMARDIYALATSTRGHVWVVSDDTVNHWDGAMQTTKTVTGWDHAIAVWPVAANPAEVWAIGEDATNTTTGILVTNGAGDFVPVPGPVLGMDERVISVRGAPKSGEVWIATTAGRLFRWSGSTWIEATTLMAGGVQYLADTADELWVVGYGGVLGRYAGGDIWNPSYLPTDLAMYSVSGGPGSVWVGGDPGSLLVHK